MNDIIFVSLELWDDVWRRNQFLCAEFAKRHKDRKILFVGPALDFSYMVRTGQCGELQRPAPRTVPEFPNIAITRPLKLAPTSLVAGQYLNEWVARLHIRRSISRLNIRNPIIWINSHSAAHLVGRIEAASVIYDITDDWTSFADQSERARDLIIAQDEELCRNADAVIVCSEKLYELKKDIATDLHIVPNGVDAEHYRQVLDGDSPLPLAASKWRKPVLGYTGTIHPERVDLELVEKLARHFVDGTVVLLGPVLLRDTSKQRLGRCGNVILPGPVAYREIPRYMRAFDVSITPHLVTPFTESLNPIKLWEYLAAGKPIVSTPVAGFRDYPNVINCASSHQEFIDGVVAALAEKTERSETRRNEVRAHSWKSRGEKVEEIMRDCVTRMQFNPVFT